jgi:hypothetical protein
MDLVYLNDASKMNRKQACRDSETEDWSSWGDFDGEKT